MTEEEIHKMIQDAGGYPNPISTTLILGILDAINKRIDVQISEAIQHHVEAYHETGWD
jgi:hypothetical protein